MAATRYLRMTRTFVVLEIGQRAYREIKSRLVAANYEHAFQKDSEGGEVIDMNGIALSALPVKKNCQKKGKK
jgi:hypothetical protein